MHLTTLCWVCPRDAGTTARAGVLGGETAILGGVPLIDQVAEARLRCQGVAWAHLQSAAIWAACITP